MAHKIKIALFALVMGIGPAFPAHAQYDPYTQCLIDYCFHNYQGDPAGYEACRQWCARTTGGPYLAHTDLPVGKLN